MKVEVNGKQISEDAIGREMQHHPAASVEAAWQAAARALAVRELLLQEAARLGVEAGAERQAGEPEDEAAIRCLLEREIAVGEPDEASCRRYFEKNRAALRAPQIHVVRHILLMAPEEPLARAEAEAKARSIIAELRQDVSRFAELAAIHSVCPSRDSGGRMGALGPGQTVPEFERALATVTPGTIAPAPIETRYGYHVVYLEERQGGEPLRFEEARPLVAAYLRESLYRGAVLDYVRRLAEKARVDGISLETAPSL